MNITSAKTKVRNQFKAIARRLRDAGVPAYYSKFTVFPVMAEKDPHVPFNLSLAPKEWTSTMVYRLTIYDDTSLPGKWVFGEGQPDGDLEAGFQKLIQLYKAVS